MSEPIYALVDYRNLPLGYFQGGEIILPDEKELIPNFRINLQLDLELELYKRTGKSGLNWSDLAGRKRESLKALILSKRP
jgi:hypothetical protein